MELSRKIYLCLVAIIYFAQTSFAAQQHNNDHAIIQAATTAYFPTTEDLTGFLVVEKPHFHGKDFVVLRRSSDPATNSGLYLVFRKVPSTTNRYTKHTAYIRKFNGVSEVEWDPVISAKTNPADGILAQVFAPALYSYAKCDYQVKTPYMAVYDYVHNHCSIPFPHQNCCHNQKPITPFGWLYESHQRYEEMKRNGRDIKSKLNVHTETLGDDDGKSKDHYDSGYKHVKNRAANPTEEPAVTESILNYLAELLKNEGEIFRRKPEPSPAPSVDLTHSTHGIRHKRQIPVVGGLFGFGGGAPSGGAPPSEQAPKKKNKKKGKKSKGSEEDSEENKKSKKGKKSKDEESDEEDRRKRSSRTKRQLPMISVLSTKISDRDMAAIQTKQGHKMLEKLEQLYDGKKRAEWKQAAWAKFEQIKHPLPHIQVPLKPVMPQEVKLPSKISTPPKYASAGKFYDSILGIYPDVTTVFQSYEYLNTGDVSMREAQKGYVFYQDLSNPDTLHTEDPTAAFTGSSTCDYQYIPMEDVTNSEDVGRFVDFHLSHLRAQCVLNLKENVVKLFEIGLLKIKSPFRVAINIDHKFLRQRIPNREDWNDAISAILFYAYTNAYMDSTEYMNRGVGYNRSPSGKPISWSVRTLTTTLFRGLELLQVLPHHAVKITKLFASVARERLMESAYAKWLLEDACKTKNCDFEMNANFNDRFQLIALMGFAVYGVDRTGQEKSRSMEDAFNSFYKANMRGVKQRAEKFGRRLRA